MSLLIHQDYYRVTFFVSECIILSGRILPHFFILHSLISSLSFFFFFFSIFKGERKRKKEKGERKRRKKKEREKGRKRNIFRLEKEGHEHEVTDRDSFVFPCHVLRHS